MPLFSLFHTHFAAPVLLRKSGIRRKRRAAFPWWALVLAGFFAACPVRADGLGEIGQLIKAGEHARALEQVNRYLAHKPKDAQGRFLKGIALTGMNRQAEAVGVFQKLTEDYPELPEPYNNLAVIYAQQKQYDKARDALEKAIRTHPAYATAHENLGDIYSRLASQAYSKALQFDAANASAQTKLAMIDSLVGAPQKGGATSAVAAAKPTAPAAPAAHPAAVVPPQPVVLAAAEIRATESARPPIPPPPPSRNERQAQETKDAVREAKPANEMRDAAMAPKPVAAKPGTAAVAEVASPPAKPAGNVEADVTAAIDGWLAAWSRKDVKVYLAHYAPDFQVPGRQTRKAWEAERTQRVGKPGKIEVSRDKLNIKVEGDTATVRFRQNYRSSGFNSGSGKTLVMSRQGNGKWLIQQERVGG